MAVKTKKPTLIEEVRRKQVIDTAIQVVSSQGFDRTTLADIAKMADVSTGVLTYHFKNKAELLDECIRALFDAPNAFVVDKVDMQLLYREKIRMYIRSNVEFMLAHRAHVAAMVHSFGWLNADEKKSTISVRQHTKIRNYLIRIVEGGQKAGEFNQSIPSATMAQLILASLEGIMVQWVLNEKAIDLPLYADELVAMVHGQLLAAE
jgi:AcrR family transcriptional regulator